MAIVRPFKGIRPSEKFAEKVISLPYDVMNRKEAKNMAEGNPYSFLHICRSEIDLSDDINPYDEKVYEKAGCNIDKFLDDGVLIKEQQPVIYIYRQVMNGRTQTGIVACVSIDEYLNNTIKRHELTRVEKEQDRINHFYVCNANTEPVFLTYRDNLKIRSIIEGIAENSEPEYDIVSDDGIRHILWVLSKAQYEPIITLFDDVDNLYIADGHHRSASAVKVGLRKREEIKKITGDEEFNYFMAAIFPDNDLKIFDYNRVIKDLNGYSKEEFIAKIKAAGFAVEKVEDDEIRPRATHEFSMFLDDEWYRVMIKNHDLIDNDDPVKSLDVYILQDRILGPVLGIEDPRTDKRIDFVGGIRGFEELERRTHKDMKVAFAVYPVSTEELLKVADEGKIMPPKSTWFEPKLGSGLFLHTLD